MREFTSQAIDELVGERGYLRSHLDLGRDTAGGPDIYHLASGLTVMAVALSAGEPVDARFLDPLQRLYPHLYIVVLGLTGTGKTRAQRIGQGILAEAVPDAFLPNDFTREAIIDVLAKQPWGLITMDEFKSMAAKFGRDYNVGLTEFFTEAFDSPPLIKRRTKAGGEIEIRRPRVTLTTGTTLVWFEQVVKAEDFEGGFLARFLYFPAAGHAPLHRPQRHDFSAIRESMVEHVRAVAKLQGQADFSAVEEFAWPWLERRHAELPDVDSRVRGFWSRLGTSAVKLAMLLHVSDTTEDLRITPEDWTRATIMMDQMAENVRDLVTEEITYTRTGKELNRLRKLLHESDGIDRRKLLRYSHLDARTFASMMATLHQTGEMHQHERRNRSGSPTTMIYEAERCPDCLAGHQNGTAPNLETTHAS